MRRSYRLILVIAMTAIVPFVLWAGGGHEPGDLVTPEEAYQLVEAGSALMVDVRSPIEYEEYHITGAILSPYFDLDDEAVARLAEYDMTLITYCACPAEETSAAVASELIARAVTNVLVLRGGIRGWAEAGYPVEVASWP
jgi:rhodanese-related sulfurtransferase